MYLLVRETKSGRENVLSGIKPVLYISLFFFRKFFASKNMIDICLILLETLPETSALVRYGCVTLITTEMCRLILFYPTVPNFIEICLTIL